MNRPKTGNFRVWLTMVLGITINTALTNADPTGDAIIDSGWGYSNFVGEGGSNHVDALMAKANKSGFKATGVQAKYGDPDIQVDFIGTKYNAGNSGQVGTVTGRNGDCFAVIRGVFVGEGGGGGGINEWFAKYGLGEPYAIIFINDTTSIDDDIIFAHEKDYSGSVTVSIGGDDRNQDSSGKAHGWTVTLSQDTSGSYALAYLTPEPYDTENPPAGSPMVTVQLGPDPDNSTYWCSATFAARIVPASMGSGQNEVIFNASLDVGSGGTSSTFFSAPLNAAAPAAPAAAPNPINAAAGNPTLQSMDMGITAGNGTQIALKKKNAAWQDDTYANEAGLNDIGPTWSAGPPLIEDPACYKVGSKPDIINGVLNATPIPAAKKFWIKVDGILQGTVVGGLKNNAFGATNVQFPAAGGPINIPALSNNKQWGATVGDVVNNFQYNMRWRVSGNGNNWAEFKRHDQKIFVLLDAPLAKYQDTFTDDNTHSINHTLVVTAKRVDWATKACLGTGANNIETGVADYISQHPGFEGWSQVADPFALLDANHAADCIRIANLAATALRIHGINAGSAMAYTQYKVDPSDSTNWGWIRKKHPLLADTYLGYPENNFEGFFYIGDFSKWNKFPSRAYTVWPRADITPATGKEKYIPIYVIRAIGQTQLCWQPGEINYDVSWTPGNSMAGVTPQGKVVSWTSDDTKDGDYTITWDKTASTMKLDTGAAVSITGDGTYTLTCGPGSIKVDIVKANLPGSNSSANVRIVPPRTQAAVP